MCFETIVVSGAEAVQSSRMGTFTKVGALTQGDRPVYQRVGTAVTYLYYWPTTSEWRISSNYATSSSGVKSTGGTGAACPDQATGWQAYANGAWVSTYTIIVVPATGQTLPPWTGPPTLPPTLLVTASPANPGDAFAASACLETS